MIFGIPGSRKFPKECAKATKKWEFVQIYFSTNDFKERNRRILVIA
jgi:hypothetical protein